MRETVVMVVFVVAISFASPSEAEWGHHGDGGMDISFMTGVTIGTNGQSGGIPVAFRFAYERVMLGAELNLIAPYGIGANVLFYVYNGPRFSAHIFDPGIFYSWGSMEISVPTMPRAFDISAGAGVEVHIADWLTVTLDWRVFLPNPFRVMPDYADYGLRAFGEALKGGQLWFGVQLSIF